MDTLLLQDRNNAVDEVIAKRRSVRVFTSEIPPKELIEHILLAGLKAPYAALAVKEDIPYRFFRVICQGPGMIKAAGLIQEQARANLELLKSDMAKNAYLREHGGGFVARVEHLAEHGLPSLRDAPYFIVVAERKGIPPVEFESLAHCLQNMWLKATALGLGFQLLSVTKMLTESREFFDMIGLQLAAFAVNGCVIGYAQQPPAEKRLFALDQVTAWL